MRVSRRLGLSLGVAVLAAGCAAGHSSVRQAPEPAVWYEANPAAISYLNGPATAVAGTPVVLTARVIVGSGSCDRFKELTARVDEASRSVVLAAVRESLRSDQPVPCTRDLRSTIATVSVSLPSPGTYRVTAERFEPTAFSADEPPRASFDIQVTAE